MQTAQESLHETSEARVEERPVPTLASSQNGKPVWLEPDLDFIRALKTQGGDSLKKCIQCGTCSATCELSPDSRPFPRKEMAWAVWGMKDHLLRDPDVWLCHQCNDCSTRCPRGARPGDVLGAVRQQCVRHYATPRFLARWTNQPHCIPLLLGVPAALLSLGLVLRDPIEGALGITKNTGPNILYPYSSLFPHWMLNTFFMFFGLLALLAVIAGIVPFWRAMAATLPPERIAAPAKNLLPSVLATLKKVFTHEQFLQCTNARSRFFSHLMVFFGFAALCLVTLWVITARYNPLIADDFIYPFRFSNPWKILANLGGAAIVAGCLLMIRDRLRDPQHVRPGSYFDWALISALLLVTLTGFATEVLHYLRLEPHRHIVYFIHLMFVFSVLMYLPYSKLAHLAYRGTAMVFAEYSDRNGAASTSRADARNSPEPQGDRDVPDRSG